MCPTSTLVCGLAHPVRAQRVVRSRAPAGMTQEQGGITLTTKDKRKLDQLDLDSTDPQSGLYLKFWGDITAPCPSCGHENTLHVDIPTNRFRYVCLVCSQEYVVASTIVPCPREK
jgi:hypothetical protein